MQNKSRIYFVVGSSRSGTTLVGQILGKHKDVHTFEELHFFDDIRLPDSSVDRVTEKDRASKVVATLMNIARDGYLSSRNYKKYLYEADQILGDDASVLWSEDEAYRNFIHYEVAKHNKKIPCEQTPRYAHHINEILDVFPNAKIINMVRDPRDVMLSQKNRWKRGRYGASSKWSMIQSWANYHPVVTSYIWRSSVRKMLAFEKEPRVLTLRFEDMVTAPEISIRKLMIFAELEFRSEMLEVGSVTSSFRNDGGVGIDSSRAQNWAKGGLDSSEIYWAEKIGNNEMALFDYKSSGSGFNLITLLVSLLILPLKLFMALLLNIRRVKNISFNLRKRSS